LEKGVIFQWKATNLNITKTENTLGTARQLIADLITRIKTDFIAFGYGKRHPGLSPLRG
jgi:hypothetical protein